MLDYLSRTEAERCELAHWQKLQGMLLGVAKVSRNAMAS